MERAEDDSRRADAGNEIVNPVTAGSNNPSKMLSPTLNIDTNSLEPSASVPQSGSAAARFKQQTEAPKIDLSSLRISAANTPESTCPKRKPQRAFIRFVGVPCVLTSETEGVVGAGSNAAADTHVVHAQTEKLPDVLCPPALSPTSAAKHLVDVIDADNEDPFTLEPLIESMRNCAEHGVDCVIARVTTLDPTDNTKYYNSYYLAHHINKILFRVQPLEGLLHRMRAKNPLNNMTILGDVHYYKITPRTYFETIAEAKVNEFENNSATPNTWMTSSANFTIPLSAETKASKGTPTSDHRSLFSRIKEAVSLKSQGKPEPDITVTSPKPHVFLVDPKIHYENKATSSNTLPPRRPSADDVLQYIAKSNSANDSVSVNQNEKYNASLQVAASISSAVLLTQINQKCIGSPSIKSDFKLRNASFKNDGRKQMRVEEWIAERYPKEDFILGVSSARPESNLEEGKLRLRNKRQTTEPQNASFFEAIFYATDDDFLMKSSVRAYFKTNTVDQSDALLFPIATGPTSLVPSQMLLFEQRDQGSRILSFWQQLTGDFDHSQPVSHPALPGYRVLLDNSAARTTRLWRVRAKVTYFLDNYRGTFLLLCLVYIIAAFFLIYFLAPEEYALFLTLAVLVFLSIFIAMLFELRIPHATL